VEFAEAISEHLAWKQRLRRILLGRERRRDPERTEAIECHDCPLDGWIQSVAAKFNQEPLFQVIDEQHRLTHDLAIQMVLNDEAEKTSMDMVFQIGQFHMCSRNLLESLEKLRRKHALSEEPLCMIPSGFPREDFPSIPDVPD
jgi:hypothetical protein